MWLIITATLLGAAFSSNPEENTGNGDVFEGDMILTAVQRAAAEAGGDVDAPVSRGAIRRGLWKGGVVVYRIDSGLSRSRKAMDSIRAGMKMWSDNTCIKFRQAQGGERSFANFQGGGGCSSYVGQSGGRQPITLASGCWYAGIVAHEIGMEFNFNKYDRSKIDSLGTPYDYSSIMHYGSTAFSKNRRPTIVAKKSGVTLGNRKRLSSVDIQQMNLLYKCSGGGGGGGGGPNPPPPTGCEDTGRYCSYHVPRGDCDKMEVVREKCRKSCGLC
ncbi:hypothetical protein OS493_028998 [Desmophyllum pertusum]|uniref:Metalloendopeptidase n=1 Tax=Desmophyllum pertusum TaxID=174260 RepID=A0A9W9YWQ3_9CNID|nr:hypothetical protein OS493_028998 [Desmophyllum pertusum]